MIGPNWYAYIYPKNIEVMCTEKIMIPDIADNASFALDETGKYAFTSGYGITLHANITESPKYILGLLNSKVLDFYLKRISTQMRGGFFRYFTQFIEPLPIYKINFSDSEDKVRHDRLVELVEQMLACYKRLAEARATQDSTMLQQRITIIDQRLNKLVYDLYGLTDEEIKTVEENTL